MARPKNALRTIILKLSTNEPLLDYLEELVLGGLYGKNSTEVAERLIAKGIQDLIKEGQLEKIKRKSNTSQIPPSESN
jgi:hypothetical protein